VSSPSRLLLLASLVLLLPVGALADATVIVELRRPDGSSTDGTVQLTKGEAKHQCTTSGGRCALGGVAGGVYTVTVEQAGQPASKQKSVVIPPSGEVKLIVNAR
jgi:hypothetical protein